MKILHYSLGLPPYRSGGLTKYSNDLMIEQVKQGHVVSLLYPSDLTVGYPKMMLRSNGNYLGVSVFEIKNPHPVSLLSGVKQPLTLNPRRVYNKSHFVKFLDKIRPEIIHLHTIMGIPVGFLQEARDRKIKIVYTSHDYFGLCLKTNFINHNNQICSQASSERCAICNSNSPSSLFLRLRNEKLIHKFKKSLILKGQLLSQRKLVSLSKSDKNLKVSNQVQSSYQSLLDYYKEIFRMIDVFHFNSSIARNVYLSSLIIKNEVIIPITHAGIKDNRRLREFSEGVLRMGFIGNLSAYKGFPLLKQVLMDDFDSNQFKWNLFVWGNHQGVDQDCNGIMFKGKFGNDDLEDVFNKMDLLIVPSLWQETFSLITLEALSYGVPVIVSKNVGAKDLVKSYDENFVYESADDLKRKLREIFNDRSILKVFNNKIIQDSNFNYIGHHAVRIYKDLYQFNLANENSNNRD